MVVVVLGPHVLRHPRDHAEYEANRAIRPAAAEQTRMAAFVHQCKGAQKEQADCRHRHQQQPVRIAIEQDSNSPQRDKGHEDDQHLEPGDQVLEKFADQSGGRVFYPYKVEDLAQSFIDIGNELRSQYFIAYAPSNAESNGKYRKIEVQTDRKNLDVRTRRGYYATTPKNPLVPSSK